MSYPAIFIMGEVLYQRSLIFVTDAGYHVEQSRKSAMIADLVILLTVRIHLSQFGGCGLTSRQTLIYRELDFIQISSL